MNLFKLKRGSTEDKLRKRLETAVLELGKPKEESDPLLKGLRTLVSILRPRKATDFDGARMRLGLLTELINARMDLRVLLRSSLLELLAERASLRMFTDAGVLSSEPFFSGLSRRIGQRLLPEELDPMQMRDVVRLLFPIETDHKWVEGVGIEAWTALLDAMRFQALENEAALQGMNAQMIEALQVVSYRIAAIGLDPELVRIHPALEQYESPFVMQNVELRDFLEERKKALADKREPTIDDKHLLVLLDQCEKLLARVRKQSATTGASVGLTALLRRLEHNIERQRRLLQLIEHGQPHEMNIDRVALFMQLVAAENRRYSVRDWWGQTVDLLATRVTQNASKAGEQYITSTRKEYLALFRSAMGAGFIVALMAMSKMWLAHEPRAPFGEAFVYSLNYAIGFVAMYLCHFSLATKQPAMTANSIAQSLEIGGRQQRVETLVEIMVRTFRSQLVAVLGNLALAVPISAALAYLYLTRTGEVYVDTEKAVKLLQDANPLALHVWLWGAMTGVWLFLTGLISGYYDNRAVYDRLPKRIAQIGGLRRILGKRGVEKLAGYVENNFGGLVGSILFGVMLGSTGALGRILGLPIDTLHVTFTAANAAYALVTLGWPVDLSLIGKIALGVSAIGTMNLTVSFGLAIWVAMRAQRVRFRDTGALLRELFRRMRKTPMQFFWPPRHAPPRELPPDGEKKKGPHTQSGGAKTRPTVPVGIVASAEAGAEKTRSKSADKSSDKGSDKSSEKSSDRGSDKSADKNGEKTDASVKAKG